MASWLAFCFWEPAAVRWNSYPVIPDCSKIARMRVIHAIYENGVFRPTDPVDLPEASEVEVELRVMKPSEERRLDTIYSILDARFESGESDVAARHDEHQP